MHCLAVCSHSFPGANWKRHNVQHCSQSQEPVLLLLLQQQQQQQQQQGVLPVGDIPGGTTQAP
jgi:hypothetical protein